MVIDNDVLGKELSWSFHPLIWWKVGFILIDDMGANLGSVFYIGLALFLGHFAGKLANRLRFPRVSGYIIAGMLLSPSILKIFPQVFMKNADIAADFALSLITYSIGGSLAVRRIKRLGKPILYITLFEAETAFFLMILGFAIVIPFFFGVETWKEVIHVALPFALLVGAMASPTDPTATLAVIHEYRARGSLTTTLLGVAASDDALGIINYSVAVGIATVLVGGKSFHFFKLFYGPAADILLSIGVGLAAGFLLSFLCKSIHREGAVISVILGTLFMAYGVASSLGADPLLATMAAGVVVANLTTNTEKMFEILEKYYEEVIFTLFFVLSGAKIQIGVLARAVALVGLFVVLRFAGKALGTFIGGKLSRVEPRIYKNLWFGLIPQGGIVVGLALATVRRPEFQQFAPLIMNLILGTTALHELLGPLFSKMAIERAGEIPHGEK